MLIACFSQDSKDHVPKILEIQEELSISIEQTEGKSKHFVKFQSREDMSGSSSYIT